MISVRSGSQVFTHRVECDGLKNSKNVKEDLDKYGYALLRGLIKREDVLRARDTVKEYHEEKVGGTKGISYTGMKEITHHKDVLNLLDAPKRIFKTLFRGKQIEISKTIYLRLIGQNETTSTHSDAFFFKSKPKSMYTCWIPFGDVRICDGPLAVCESSHEIEGYDDDIAIREEIPWGYVSVANNVVWKTTDFKAGDVLIFDARTIHGSLKNKSNSFRISCDTRFHVEDCIVSK